MGLTRDEKEVSIGLGPAWGEFAVISDFREQTYNTLTAAGYPPDHIHMLSNGDKVGWTWTSIPANDIRLGSNGRVYVAKKRGLSHRIGMRPGERKVPIGTVSTSKQGHPGRGG